MFVFLVFLILPSITYSRNFSKGNPEILKNVQVVKRYVQKYPKKKLLNSLRQFISCCRPNRFVGSSGHSQVIPFLVQQIKSFSSTGNTTLNVQQFSPDIVGAIGMYKDDFKKEIKANYGEKDPTYLKWQSFTKGVVGVLKSLRDFKGKNLIWEKKGTGPGKEMILLGANFDTIAYSNEGVKIEKGFSMPGADHNGTGVALLLGLIELLSQVELKKTVRIIFFDFQEMGFLGSKAYLKDYIEEMKSNYKIKGFINPLMLGHDTKRDDRYKKLGNFKAYIRKPGERGHKEDKAFFDEIAKIGKKMTSGVRFELEANGFNASDHIRFWKNDIPSIVFSQNWEDDFNKKRHHTSNDFIETLNFDTFYRSFLFIAGSVLTWSSGI